jgi:two-component system response regulator FixJ
LIEMTMSSERIVHIVDDDTDIRHSLAQLLESAGYTTTTFASGSTFLAVAPRLSEGCVLLDVQMPCMDGFAVLEAFRKQGIRLPVVVMSVHGNVATAVRAMRDGAFEFVDKPFDDAPLLATIDNALTHPGPFRHDLEVARAIERIAELSPREHEVLAGHLAGRSNKTIAYDLNISVRMVEVYRARLMERLGVQTFAEVIRVGVLASLRCGN